MPPLLNVEGLQVHFHTWRGTARAVDGVDFELDAGGVLGIVGESGSGKSVSCLALTGLIACPPGKISATCMELDGQSLLGMSQAEYRKVRGRKIGMIFQDPMSSLNPYLKISTQLIEAVQAHERVPEREALRRSVEMLERVGIHDAPTRIDQYPHHFSGGMRQRVMIAQALLNRPQVLIADEPTTALDVTIQAQILELIDELRRTFGMAVILISHDTAVVAKMSGRVSVMYAGKVVEHGDPRELFSAPRHPYTKGLAESIPAFAIKKERLKTIPGKPPDLFDLPPGCPFSPRCEYVSEICRETYPPLRRSPSGGYFHCHADIR